MNFLPGWFSLDGQGDGKRLWAAGDGSIAIGGGQGDGGGVGVRDQPAGIDGDGEGGGAAAGDAGGAPCVQPAPTGGGRDGDVAGAAANDANGHGRALRGCAPGAGGEGQRAWGGRLQRAGLLHVQRDGGVHA